MRRRTLLAAASALLAGCSGSDETSTGSTTLPGSRSTTGTSPATEVSVTETPASGTEATAPGTETTTGTTTARPYDLIPAEPASASADEVQDSLADRDCAGFTDRPRACPDSDGRLSVSISPRVGRLSDGAVEFTVENAADEPFVTNHYDWELRKWDGSSWRRIAPLSIPAPLDRIPPDESHAHRITSTESGVIDGLQAYASESDVVLGGLGPGVYGFSTRGYFESAPDEELRAGAAFGFAGRAPPVRPTDDVTSVERDESTLLVRADVESDERAELVISLADGDPDATLLAEHVHQLGALLGTLPYAATEGVEKIRYLGPSDEVNVVDSYLSAVTPDGATRYGFRDHAFEVAAGSL